MNLVTIVEHGKTGNCDESGDSRQHGESVDSGWFCDFGVYQSGESLVWHKIYDLMFKCKKQIY